MAGWFIDDSHNLSEDRHVCVCVVSVIVKHPVLPPCVVDGCSRNPLHCYYYIIATTVYLLMIYLLCCSTDQDTSWRHVHPPHHSWTVFAQRPQDCPCDALCRHGLWCAGKKCCYAWSVTCLHLLPLYLHTSVSGPSIKLKNSLSMVYVKISIKTVHKNLIRNTLFLPFSLSTCTYLFSVPDPVFKINLKQSWLPVFWNKIQKHKRLKQNADFNRTTRNIGHTLGQPPFIKQRTWQVNGDK